MLRGVQQKHVAELAVLRHHYRRRFPLWSLQLREGFNLLFYGLGSKRKLLQVRDRSACSARVCVWRLGDDHAASVARCPQTFAAEAAGQHPVIEVNGYMPWFSMKNLLQTISSKLLWHHSTFPSLVDHVRWRHVRAA